MTEFDDMVSEMRRKIRADLFGDGSAVDSIMADVAQDMDDVYNPVRPLPRLVLRGSAMYDDKTGVMTSADVEITTSRYFDPDLIRHVMDTLQGGTMHVTGEVEP